MMRLPNIRGVRSMDHMKLIQLYGELCEFKHHFMNATDRDRWEKCKTSVWRELMRRFYNAPMPGGEVPGDGGSEASAYRMCENTGEVHAPHWVFAGFHCAGVSQDDVDTKVG